MRFLEISLAILNYVIRRTRGNYKSRHPLKSGREEDYIQLCVQQHCMLMAWHRQVIWHLQALRRHRSDSVIPAWCAIKRFSHERVEAGDTSTGNHYWFRGYHMHYCDVIMDVSIGVSNHQPHGCLLAVYSDAVRRKHQNTASMAFVRGIHRGPVNSTHKCPVTRKMFPFDVVIMVLWTSPELAPLTP